MKPKPVLFVCLLFFLQCITLSATAQGEKKKCCDNSDCAKMARELASKIAGITVYLTNCQSISADSSKLAKSLSELATSNPQLYSNLLKYIKLADKHFLSDNSTYGDAQCFDDALPGSLAEQEKISCWIAYIRLRVLKIKPIFPSTEFCKGLSRRFELAQGSTAFLGGSKMAYLGSFRGYLAYTFKKTDPAKTRQCGGHLRLSAGTGLFIRQNDFYLALCPRVAYRLTDIKSAVFSLANLNLFVGYNTNFKRFNYLECGLEAEIGPIGINLSGNLNAQNGKPGFLTGIVFGNKKFKKKETNKE